MSLRKITCHLLAVALGTSVILGSAGCAGTTASAPAESGITVNGTASVPVVPDIASISVGVTTRGKSASSAQKSHAEPVNAVLACLRDNGIDDKDIQTTYTDISPTWDDEGNENGYEARTYLTIDNVAVEDVSAIMEACVEAGATDVSGPDYHTTSYEDAYQEALSQAIEATRPKAEAIAKASGATLGKVTAVTEGYQNMTVAAEEAKAMSDAGADSIEIAPGEVSIEASVTVTYAIN